MPIKTDILKLEAIDTVADKNMTGKLFIELTAGIGENNLKKIDDFAGKTNTAITDIKDSPSVIYIRAVKELDGIYTADVGAIKKLIRNGIYVVSLSETNNVGAVSLKINGVITVELKKIDRKTQLIVPLEIGEVTQNMEYIFRYTSSEFVMVANDAFTLKGKDLSELVQKSEVIDNATSIDVNLPLAANQGKVLNEKIDTVKSEITNKIDAIKGELTDKIDLVQEEINDKIDLTKTELTDKINLKAPIESPTFTGTVSGITGEMVGLGNLTNDSQVKRSEMGVANGVASLDGAGLVPSNQLPSYVDDVLEFDTPELFPAVGEPGKIYVAIDTNLTYRWSGTQYVEISKSLALGETSSTAYPGNKGKQNADDITGLKSSLATEIINRTQGDTDTLASSKTYADTSIVTHNTSSSSHSVEMGKKADLLSPAFTGAPTSPTAPDGNSTTQLATTAFATTAISNHNSISGAHSVAMANKVDISLENVNNTVFNTKAKESGMQPFLYMECTGDGNPNFTLTPMKAHTTLDYTKPYPVIFKPSANILPTSVFYVPFSPGATTIFKPHIGQISLSSLSRTINTAQYIYAVVALGDQIIYLQESSSIGYDASNVVNILGNLRLKGTGNYGNKINFGDNEYVSISEDADALSIKGSQIKLFNGATEVIGIAGNIAIYKGKEIVSKSTLYSATISVSNIVGTAAPYTFTQPSPAVTATSVQEIKLSQNATLAQIEAAQSANIQDGGQVAGSITLKLWGEKPTIDIPIEIIVRGDL